MPQRRQPVVVLAGASLAAAGLVLGGPATAASSPSTALTGAVSSASVSGLAVYVQPDQDIVAAAALGQTLDYYRVPSSAVSMTGDHYEVTVRPQDLPDWAIGDNGVATFEVVALDASGTPVDATEASVRAVYDSAGTPRWADPLASTVAAPVFPGGDVTDSPSGTPGGDTLLGPVTADLSSVTGLDAPPNALTDDEAALPNADDATEVTSDDSAQQEVGTTTATASTCYTGQGAGNVKMASKVTMAIVGTGYPLDGDTSTMSYTATTGVDYDTTFGIANDAPGYWQAKGTKSISRGVGFDWDNQNYARAYKVGVEMYKIGHYYDRCPPSPPYYRSWEPGRLASNAGENSNIKRPDFTHCLQWTSSMNWWRVNTNGSSYSLSYGLNFAKTVGFDLSSKRAYNAEGKLGYHITAGRWLCGNNDAPAYAGKVMERLHNA